jgi:hypothetical protein
MTMSYAMKERHYQRRVLRSVDERRISKSGDVRRAPMTEDERRVPMTTFFIQSCRSRYDRECHDRRRTEINYKSQISG